MKSQQLLAQGEVLEDEVIPESERRKQSSRADIEGAQTSENLNEMRAMQAVSQVIDSANVRNYGEPQLHRVAARLPSVRKSHPQSYPQ